MRIGGRIDFIEPCPELILRYTTLPMTGDLRRIHDPGEETQNDHAHPQRRPNTLVKALGLEFEGIFDRTDRSAIHAPVTFRTPNLFLARHG